jgi:TonB family protein
MTWKTNLGIRVALSAGLTTMALARAAHGAEAAAPLPSAEVAPAQPAALTPPRLVKFVDAVYPEAAKVAGKTASVDLELSLDSAGKVADAKVVAPIGEGFDEAAVVAVRQFQFEPARRGDQAIAARIRYRYVFELAAPPPTTGALDGRVLLQGGDDLVLGAKVTLSSADGSVTRTVATDAEGSFAFGDLPPGSYRLKVAGTDLAPVDVKENVTAGDITSVTYRLAAVGGKAPTGELEFGATAVIEAPPREVTKRTLKAEELLRVAGTRGDALKAIEYMPGVSRGSMGFVIIRGSAPGDSEVQFEGAPVFRLYHFGDLTSFVNSRMLERIDLYPGNFSARYGRKLGGIIDVGIRDPKSDRFHGMVDINVVDSQMLIETPIGSRASIAIAAKRSYIDFFIDKLVPEEIGITAAPVYYDYQVIGTYRPTDKDRIRAMIYGSYDDFKLVLKNPDNNDPNIRGSLSQRTAFHRGQLLWKRTWTPDLEHEVNVTSGPFEFGTALGPELSLKFTGIDTYARSEVRARMHERVQLLAGLDVAYFSATGKYTGPAIEPLDGNPNAFGPLAQKQNLDFDRKITALRPAAYAEMIIRPTDRLTLIPGGRFDHYGDISRWSFDPRFTGRYQVLEGTAIKGGVGLFTQAPDLGESAPVIGNPNIKPSRALHYGFGIEQQVGERLQLTMEGFAKRLEDLVVQSPVPGENLTNDGTGRIWGGEASARLNPNRRTTGFVSYTLSRSTRNDRGEGWRLFSWDQTHILTVAGSLRLGNGWDLSSTFRYVTGNPMTPVKDSTYNANVDLYRPVYGGVNSERNPVFHRLDLRIEKTWQISTGSLAAYLDLQNAYNRRSQEGRAQNYNFTQSRAIPGLPVIPSIGIRGEI